MLRKTPAKQKVKISAKSDQTPATPKLDQSSAPLLISPANKPLAVKQQGPVAKDDVHAISRRT